MAHHLLPHLRGDWLGQLTNAFLIRDPAEMLPSLAAQGRASRCSRDTGLPQQVEIFRDVRARTGADAGRARRRGRARGPARRARPALRARRRRLRRARCSTGRRDAGRPTASGRSTGTTRSSVRPASSRRSPRPRHGGAGAASRCSTNACPTTTSWRRTGCAPEVADAADRSIDEERRPDRQHQRPARPSRRGGRQPVRLRRAGRRRGLGRPAALRRPDLPARRAPRPAAQLGAGAGVRARSPPHDEIIERDPPHAGGQRDARRRAHPPDADARRQDHLRHGPAAQPVGADADRAGRAQAAGLRHRRASR